MAGPTAFLANKTPGNDSELAMQGAGDAEPSYELSSHHTQGVIVSNDTILTSITRITLEIFWAHPSACPLGRVLWDPKDHNAAPACPGYNQVLLRQRGEGQQA